jgi:hypothetical protein
MEFWNSSGVKGFELGILQGYNYEKHVSSTGGVWILNGIAHFAAAELLIINAPKNINLANSIKIHQK